MRWGPHGAARSADRRHRDELASARPCAGIRRRSYKPPEGQRHRPPPRRPTAGSLLAPLVGVVVLDPKRRLELFFRMSSAAASARAFSLRASSRSSPRIRFVTALDDRPSSSSARRHCSSSARRTPCCSRNADSCSPVSVAAPARILILSSIVQAFGFLGGGTRGRLRASSSQRESVVCGTPISCPSWRALIASFPISRVTALVLNAGENGLVTSPSIPRPQGRTGNRDNYPATGGVLSVSPMSCTIPPLPLTLRPLPVGTGRGSFASAYGRPLKAALLAVS
jgi:hypothetical protein